VPVDDRRGRFDSLHVVPHVRPLPPKREDRPRGAPHDLVGRRSEEHQNESIPLVHAHDDEIRRVLGGDAQDLPVRLASLPEIQQVR
jgi:hypothetical protein